MPRPDHLHRRGRFQGGGQAKIVAPSPAQAVFITGAARGAIVHGRPPALAEDDFSVKYRHAADSRRKQGNWRAGGVNPRMLVCLIDGHAAAAGCPDGAGGGACGAGPAGAGPAIVTTCPDGTLGRLVVATTGAGGARGVVGTAHAAPLWVAQSIRGHRW